MSRTVRTSCSRLATTRAACRLALVAAILPAACSTPTGDEPGSYPLDTALAVPVNAVDAENAARAVLDWPDDLRVTSIRYSLTGEHVRFAQLADDGTPLLGVETSVHLRGTAPDFVLRRIRSNAIHPLRLDGRRSVDRTAAIAGALAAARQADPAKSARALYAEPAVLPLGGDRGRPGWRVVVDTAEPPHEWEIFVDGETGAGEIQRDLIWFADGTGYVYRPNPLSETGDLTLTDNNDNDSAALTAARRLVTLQGLDGSGRLVGDYVDVYNDSGYLANQPSLDFDYTRSQDEFEEVNAYYHIDHAQRNLQALGFDGARTIVDFPIEVNVSGTTMDNSWYTPGDKTITYGTGGVDDAEDGDIIIHEYGHAVLYDIVPGFGLGGQAGAIGEAYSDMLAASTPTEDSELIDRACVGAWDATSYDSGSPPCLRRVDGHKHYPEHWVGEVHDDGEIWSGAMWNLYTATGLGRDGGIQLLTEAAFSYSPSESFEQSANAILAADQDLHGGSHAAELNRVLIWHGLLSTISPQPAFTPPIDTFATSIASPSSIPNLADGHETITHPGAAAIRVHYNKFNMRSGDNVYIYDGAGLLYAIESGKLNAHTSVAVPGDTIVVRWVTNGNNQSNGFSIDSYDITTIGLPDAGVPDAALPDAAVVIEPDAAAGTPDAMVETPDAAAGTPDATVDTPDATVDTPDAGVGTPDAMVETPDAGIVFLDAAVDTPDAAVVTPDAGPTGPDAGPGVDSGGAPDAGEPGDPSAGCGCTTGGTDRDSAGGLLLLLGLFGVARRQRWV